MEINEFLKTNSLPDEEWKPVKDFEGLYMISNMGRLCSVGGDRPTKNGHIRHYNWYIHAVYETRGYNKQTLYSKDKSKSVMVHRLVAEAFIPNPENKSQVDHIDGNKLNNKASNLRWTTPSENCQNPNTKPKYPVRLGNRPTNQDLAVVGISLTDGSILEFNTVSSVKDLGFHPSNVSKCCKGKRPAHKGYKWMYLSDYKKQIKSND